MNKTMHVAITRKVKPGCEEDFEKAILRFFADSQKSTATLGALLLKPFPGSEVRTYGILRSFASQHDREAYYESDRFLRWEKAVKPLVEEDYSRQELHGLEAFFTNPRLIKKPVLWKMAFVTWLGVWPSVLAVALLVGNRIFSGLPLWLNLGFQTMIVVVILTWGVMPVLTRLFRSWLLGSADIQPKERNGP